MLGRQLRQFWLLGSTQGHFLFAWFACFAVSLQDALGYFERVARLRLVTEDDAEFRQWLRTRNDTLGNQSPLDLLKAGLWQALADKVEDMLTGMPT